MTDLFDRAAMRVLGSQANLRPRRRTRFEPMIGSQPSANTDQAAPWDIAPIEDDPLAPSAMIVEQARTIAPRQTAKAAISTTDPHVRLPSSSAPLAQTGEPPADRHLPTNEEEQPTTKPTARGQQSTAALSSAPPVEEASAPQASTLISRRVAAPPATAHSAVRRVAVAGEPPPSAPQRNSDPPVERPVTVDGSASNLTIETVAAAAPIIMTSRRSVASAPTSRPTSLEFASESPTPTDIAPSSTPDVEPFSDPLGVRARARIAQRPSGAPGRPLAAPPPSSPPVEVTIGRLEIRADTAPTPPKTARPFEPHLDLAAYRARKERGA